MQTNKKGTDELSIAYGVNIVDDDVFFHGPFAMLCYAIENS